MWIFCAAAWLFMAGWRLLGAVGSSRYFENLFFLTALLAIFAMAQLAGAHGARWRWLVAIAVLITLTVAAVKNLRPPNPRHYLYDLAVTLNDEYAKSPNDTVIFDETGNLKRMGYLLDRELIGEPVLEKDLSPEAMVPSLHARLKTVFSEGHRLLFLIKPESPLWWRDHIETYCTRNGIKIKLLAQKKYRGEDIFLYEFLPPSNHWPEAAMPHLGGTPIWRQNDFFELQEYKNPRHARIVDRYGKRLDMLPKNWAIWSDEWSPDCLITLAEQASGTPLRIEAPRMARWHLSRILDLKPGHYSGLIQFAGEPGTRVNMDLTNLLDGRVGQSQQLLSTFTENSGFGYYRFSFSVSEGSIPPGKSRLEIKFWGRRFAITSIELHYAE